MMWMPTSLDGFPLEAAESRAGWLTETAIVIALEQGSPQQVAGPFILPE